MELHTRQYESLTGDNRQEAVTGTYEELHVYADIQDIDINNMPTANTTRGHEIIYENIPADRNQNRDKAEKCKFTWSKSAKIVIIIISSLLLISVAAIAVLVGVFTRPAGHGKCKY